jgi:chromosome segregation ATPase
MEKIPEFLKYLIDHPAAMYALGALIIAFITGPFIIIWARGGRMRKIEKVYNDLFSDLSKRIANLYRDITALQEELATTRGELSEKKAELKSITAQLEDKEEYSESLSLKVDELQKEVEQLKSKEAELLDKIRNYEANN